MNTENLVENAVDNSGYTYVPGEILTSTLWTQSGVIYVEIDGVQKALSGYTYNQFCPLIDPFSEKHSVTGCSNTADSQILYYWLERGYDLNLSVDTQDYYTLGFDQEKYYVSDNPTNGEISMKQLNTLLARSGEDGILFNGDFIAALNYYCGVKNNSEYAASTSTSWYVNVYSNGTNADAFRDAGFDSYYFIAANTSRTESKRMFDVTGITDIGYSVLRENFDYGEVVRIGVPGHAIYMDGYRYNSETREYEYHLNYGWGVSNKSTKWYTTKELSELDITYMTIDISPDIYVEVTNSRSDYYGGSFLRGMERINHIQNDTATSFKFDDSIAGGSIVLAETAAINSKVDVSFTNLNVDIYTESKRGFTSFDALGFYLDDGSISVNSTNSEGALFELGGETMTVELDQSWIYSGIAGTDFESIVDAFECDTGYSIDSLSDLLDTIAGYSVYAGVADDSVTLSNSSALFGDISLGEGENILNVETGSLIYGDFYGKPGTLSVNIQLGKLNKGPVIVLDDVNSAGNFYSMTGGVITVDTTGNTLASTYELVDLFTTGNMQDYQVVVNNGASKYTLSYYERSKGGYTLNYNGTTISLAVEKGGTPSPGPGTDPVAPSTKKAVFLYTGGKLSESADVMSGKSVGSGSYIVVSSGGTARSNTFSNGGYMEINSAGIADSNTVNSNGVVTVYTGGSAVNNNIYTNGTLNVAAGGKAYGTTVHTNGKMAVSAGAAVSGTTLSTRGSMDISGAGATAANTTVGNQASLTASNKAELTSTTVSSGNVSLTNSAKASTTTLNGGLMTVAANSEAVNTTVNTNGKLNVNSGGSANSTVINSAGSMSIASGASASKSTVKAGAVMVISGGVNLVNNNYAAGVTGGSATDTSVLAGGTLNVTANGVAVNTVAAAGATVNAVYTEVYNPVWTTDPGYAIATDQPEFLEAAAFLDGTDISYGAVLNIDEGSVLRGNMLWEGDINVGGVIDATQADITFVLNDRSSSDAAIVNDLSLLKTDSFSVCVSTSQASGKYLLAENAYSFNDTVTVGSEFMDFGTIGVNQSVSYNGATYKLALDRGNLTLQVSGTQAVSDVDSNLLSNGVSQILAWDSDQGKVGYLATNGSARPAWKGVWEWSGAEADLWRVAGVGHFKGTGVDYDGVLLYNGVGDRFAAWTNLRTGSYGYVNLCKVDGSFNTECLTDLNGNEYDDILIYDDNGSIGVVLDGTTYKDIWHVNKGQYSKWELVGAGSFGSGSDKLVMINNDNNFIYLWTNNDPTFSTWSWSTKQVGKLDNGWEVAAVGDFEGDGIDDIMVLDRRTNNVWVWDDGNVNSKRWRGTMGTGFEIEGVGDYNGDGKDDLLLREYNSGWGGMGYWGAGYAGNWTDLSARIETDLNSSFAIIA